ncbi:hypothetical protein Cgig2_026421 [Carnegiea gigantea]|uniref:lipid-A-disaccharide synthase n=1 Tax=Carnegiea gigantea TaxID=171969 RepID=A0A9Q1JLJ6_9CARY|nr:hypothetical protein Cgig2_026421 [Carnegiea gigantea]
MLAFQHNSVWILYDYLYLGTSSQLHYFLFAPTSTFLFSMDECSYMYTYMHVCICVHRIVCRVNFGNQIYVIIQGDVDQFRFNLKIISQLAFYCRKILAMLAKANFVMCSRIRWASGVLRRFMWVSGRDVIDDAAKDGELRVFIVSCEVSGDTIGGRLMASLKKISAFPVKFCGVGGSMMSQHGLQSLFPMEDLAVMGIWELSPHLSKFRVCRWIVLLLWPPFLSNRYYENTMKKIGEMPVAASCSLQELDSPLHFHFVAPSFWAWKGGEARLKRLFNFVDRVFCILPFEEEACRVNGLPATLVGHPVLEDCSELIIEKNYINWKAQRKSGNFRNKFEIPPGDRVITLLPGSRLQEVARMLPIFVKIMELLKGSFPELKILLNVASNQHVENYIIRVVHHWPVAVILIPGNSTDLMYDASIAHALKLRSKEALCTSLGMSSCASWTLGQPFTGHIFFILSIVNVSSAALCPSGTVSVQLQLARLPCVVAYRAHILTERLIRYKAKVSYISLPNIVVDSPVIPEPLFQRCTPQRLASLLSELIDNEALRTRQMCSAEKVIRLLCPPENNAVQYDSKSDWRGTSPPSMIAASTLLYDKRQR